jgi:hypothetical protein
VEDQLALSSISFNPLLDQSNPQMKAYFANKKELKELKKHLTELESSYSRSHSQWELERMNMNGLIEQKKLEVK